MERIANPVTGRTDAYAPPLTTSMVLCRYALAILTPAFITIGALGAETLSWWGPLSLSFVILLPLSAGANGSWWRSAPWGAWHTAMLVQTGLLVVAFVATILSGEQLVMIVAAALLVGGALGAGGLRLWQRSRFSRP
jgi:hypothetical protein